MTREGDYAPNQRIPGTVYQVIRVLGSGGMGTVYEVEDTTVGKRYVVKTLHADLKDRQELAIRITKEARTLAKLSHANIVEVVTAGATADELRLPYFVMQKLNGHTLRSIISAKGRLPLETAYGIAIDLLDALEHAHAYGVIHRDVKPENIFIHRNVNGTYVTKLLDFGVMRLLSNEVGMTGHRFVGTLRYAPPEQLMGGAITPRTDLYAAALVLYEMIAGRGPFDELPTDREIASAHIEREPPRLATYATIPQTLDELVASALSKDPADRPIDAFTFASALRELARNLSAAQRISASGVGTGTPFTTVEDTTRPVSSRAPRRQVSAPTQPSQARIVGTQPPAPPEPPSKTAGRALYGAIAFAGVATIGILAATFAVRRNEHGSSTSSSSSGDLGPQSSASSIASASPSATALASTSSASVISAAVSASISSSVSTSVSTSGSASASPPASPPRVTPHPRTRPSRAPQPARKVPGPGF